MIPAATGTPKAVNVLVIGNSNSVAVTSYANLLAEMPGINVVNASIGGVPNIMLLAAIAEDNLQLSMFDVIVVEPAVIEGQLLYPGSPYTKEQSEQTFDLFMACLRARSAAPVIVLILPVLSCLIDASRNIAEQHYQDIAAKHGLAVLNGYSMMRELGRRAESSPPAQLIRNVEGMIAAFSLPPSSRDQIIWRLWLRQPPGALHRANIGTTAFVEHAFEDPMHVSRAFHDLLAKLIHRWITAIGHLDHAGEVPDVGVDLLLKSLPSPSDPTTVPIHRQSKLISRFTVPLDTEGFCTYTCPKGYRAAAIVFNESMTSGFLTFQSPAGRSMISIRPAERPMQWNAAIVAILDDVGDGDITVRVATVQPDWNPPPKPHYLTPSGAAPRGTAELCEILLVKRDWRRYESEPKPGLASALGEQIQAAPWAQTLMADHASTCAKAYDGMRRSTTLIKRPVFNAIAAKAAHATHQAEWLASQARLLVVAEELEAARALLKVAAETWPENSHFAKMTQALNRLAD